jgi:D-tyrosyl-tRNA(Tyr) deacylase
MKIIAQRVSYSKVIVENSIISELDKGLLLYVRFTHNDAKKEVEFLADKILHLRIFVDRKNKMNLSIKDVNGQINVISQFTLYADTSKGRKPDFGDALAPAEAKTLYQYFIEILKLSELTIGKGSFGDYMKIESVNEGPATFILEK